MVMLWSSGAIPAIVVEAMSLLSGSWLASKCRVTAIVRLIVVKVIICKTYAASVGIRVLVKVMVNAHVGCHFGKMRAIGVRVGWCSSTCRSLPLAFLILPQIVLFSRSKLGIDFRGVISLGDVYALVNLGLWGNIGLAVSPFATATSSTTTEPFVMAAAIITPSGLMWGS